MHCVINKGIILSATDTAMELLAGSEQSSVQCVNNIHMKISRSHENVNCIILKLTSSWAVEYESFLGDAVLYNQSTGNHKILVSIP